MTEGIRVLVVDDQPRARQSLKALLATDHEIGRVDEAERGEEAVDFVRASAPDVILMDVRMPGMDGLAATRIIKSLRPDINLVVLSLYPEYREEALAAGANGFIVKGGPSEELFAAILMRERHGE